MIANRFTASLIVSASLLSLAASLPALAASANDGENILNGRCQSCHVRQGNGDLEGIAGERRTPEGWDMTISRMRLWHGVQVPEDEQRALVEYLSDTQGLAPEETSKFRYILERRPDVVEAEDKDLTIMCARCHSLARIGLQRRDDKGWTRLVHMHLGQFPTIEYQASGRDRDWFGIALKETSKLLAERFPFAANAWADWQKRSKKSPEGSWRVVGHQPGVGSFNGTATVSKSDQGFKVRYALTYDDGKKLTADGNVSLYSGYEWRGSTKLNGQDVREVFALSSDGNSFSGRFYNANMDSIGGEMTGARADQKTAQILSVNPGRMKAGETATVSIHGINLKGNVDLGSGVIIKRVVEASPNSVVVEAVAKPDAKPGASKVGVGETTADNAFAVYKQIDSVRVEPAYALARIGGNGPTPAVPAQFEAVGYLNGPDGKPETDDDVRLGVFPATWTNDDFNEDAKRMQDAKFAGQIDGKTGLFVPRDAGPNPARVFGTNNAGEQAVIAKVRDGDHELEGKGHLVVTVQRWNDPPVR